MDDVAAGRRWLRKVKAIVVGGAVTCAVLAPATSAGATRSPVTVKPVTSTHTPAPNPVKPRVTDVFKTAGRKVS
jgi:hypothetical protein